MPTKPKRLKETPARYTTRRKPARSRASGELKLPWAEIERATAPIILERNGQPAAVVLRYDEYQRLEAERAERRQKAWQKLSAVLSEMYPLTKDVPQEEIEADITAAREEVRELHRQSVKRR